MVALVLSIAGINIYRWKTDVLTGPYISNRDQIAEWTELTGRQRKEAHDAPLPAMLLALNAQRKATGYSYNRATDLSRLRAKKTVGRLTAKSGLTRNKAEGFRR